MVPPFAILHFDPPVDARTGTGKLRLLDIFAVIDHQRDRCFRPSGVARHARVHTLCWFGESRTPLHKIGCLLQIVDFDGDLNDTGHAFSSLQKFDCVLK